MSTSIESQGLNLCIVHQQESNRSHFDPTNCDYCKVVNVLELAKATIERLQRVHALGSVQGTLDVINEALER